MLLVLIVCYKCTKRKSHFLHILHSSMASICRLNAMALLFRLRRRDDLRKRETDGSAPQDWRTA